MSPFSRTADSNHPTRCPRHNPAAPGQDPSPAAEVLVTKRDGRRGPLPDAGLPDPVVVPADLGARGGCRAAEPDLFDIDDVASAPELAGRALAICASCPVRARCLAYAMANEPYGIWGGMDAVARLHLRGAPLPDSTDRADAARLRARLRAGVTAGTIAREYGVSVRTVMRWKAAAGITTTSPGTPARQDVGRAA